MYEIYKLTSPSGKFYIGLTSQSTKVRWSNHVRKAFTHIDYNHGLYNAIRKYGASAFSVEIVDTAPSKQDAQRLEKRHIAASDKTKLYNISPGGEADGEFGGKLFWATMNADPEAKAAYLEKLSASLKIAAARRDYSLLADQVSAWRRDNPREAYRLAARGLRVAMRNQPRRPEDTRPLKERLMWKHKRGEMVRRNTTAFWASASPEMRDHISTVNREKSIASWKEVTDPSARSEKTSAARAAIDRKKQGAAASKGIKQWWVDLKADPERYADYITRRRETLLKTIKGNK